MKLFKLTVICGSILSLSGCFSTPTNPDTTYKPALSAAYVDLLIEKAKAEERARVMAELAAQNQDDKRFSEIKINQLESKLEQLEQPKGKRSEEIEPAEVKEDIVIENAVTTTHEQNTDPQQTSVEASNVSTSQDPLLEQWKTIYAQSDDASSEKNVASSHSTSETQAVEVVQYDEIPSVESESATQYQQSAEPTVILENTDHSSEVASTTQDTATIKPKQTYDTVIRQCVAGQTIPDPYLGSLPEVLNGNVKPGDKVRLPTLCKWSRSPEIIKQLQIALSERGFLKPSPPYDLEVIDGIWGINTLNSLIRYQKSRGLAYGQLSIESLVDLGVIDYSDVVNRKGSSQLLKSEVPPDVGLIEKNQNIKAKEYKPKEDSISSKLESTAPAVNTPKVTTPDVSFSQHDTEEKNLTSPKHSDSIQTEVEQTKAAPTLSKQQVPESPSNSVTFKKAETKYCYVNQVIPGDYKGNIPELVKNSKESKVGYVQELPTLCKKDRSEEIIKRLQRSLYGAGYLKGGVAAINGVWNKNTLNAVRAYQKDHGLAYGQLSIEVLESLGVM